MLTEAKVALLTGSTRGIGRQIALRWAREGTIPVLNYLKNDQAAQETLRELQKASPQSFALQADVSQPDQAASLVQSVAARFGRLDILVNGAGPFLRKTLSETSDAEWRRMLDSNLSSTFYCCRNALPIMRGQRSGNIINFSAMHAESYAPTGSLEADAYWIAKAGVALLTRCLARSEGPFNIRVNAIAPGFIYTEDYPDFYSQEVMAGWRQMIPMGRFGQIEEVVEAVSFLVSERASYVSGAVLHVHGGLWR